MQHGIFWYHTFETVGAGITYLPSGPDAALVQKLGEDLSNTKKEGEGIAQSV
jgi:hypothetical protein